MKEVSKKLHDHYRNTFLKYGATSKGVDWGDKEWTAELRQAKMLEVIKDTAGNTVSLLDVGCGYGALADVIKGCQRNVAYAGIDVVAEMISEAKKRHPDCEFISGDIMEVDIGKHDYVVCNGILTQKLETTNLEMDQFANKLIKRMFELCNVAIAFNVMSTKVNYFSNNLYYRNPAELFSWCVSEVSESIKLDHSYPLYEYTIYLYRDKFEN